MCVPLILLAPVYWVLLILYIVISICYRASVVAIFRLPRFSSADIVVHDWLILILFAAGGGSFFANHG
jgi:hypothetical protein